MGVAAYVSCTDEPPTCYDGEYRSCACGTDFGYQLCSGEAFDECDCNNPPPGLGGGPPATGAGGADGAGGAALLPFMSMCMKE